MKRNKYKLLLLAITVLLLVFGANGGTICLWEGILHICC